MRPSMALAVSLAGMCIGGCGAGSFPERTNIDLGYALFTVGAGGGGMSRQSERDVVSVVVVGTNTRGYPIEMIFSGLDEQAVVKQVTQVPGERPVFVDQLPHLPGSAP
jgi:hypothetical protein